MCCSVTHCGTTPVDVFETQIQMKPVKYMSFFSADENTISDVSGALTTGGTPTSQRYFVQGWSKFDGVEIWKTRFEMGMDKQDARKNREFNTLGGPAVSEFATDAFLYPFEACRTRSGSDPSNAKEVLASGQKLVAESGGTSSTTSRMNKMLRFALSQWNNGCKGRWIHRTTTTMRWREVWRRTTWRILPIRRLFDHAVMKRARRHLQKQQKQIAHLMMSVKDAEILRVIEERRNKPKGEQHKQKDVSKCIKRCTRDKKRMKRQVDIRRILKDFKGIRNIPKISHPQRRDYS